MRAIAVVLLLLSITLLLFSAVTTPAFVPTSETAVVTRTVGLRLLHLNNTSASTVTCTVKDRSTGCNSGACTLWGPAPLGAAGEESSIVRWEFDNTPATNGFTWSCTAANAVVGSVQYQ
jgi:hypothetical protein